MYLTDTLAKCHKISLHILPFQNILHSFSFSEKNENTYFGYGQGVCPTPPVTDRSVTYSFFVFITPSLSEYMKENLCFELVTFPSLRNTQKYQFAKSVPKAFLNHSAKKSFINGRVIGH